MKTGCFINPFRTFFLCTAFISALTGCGANGSPANSGTGSIAVNLTWSTPKSLAAKTLYAAPTNVANIQIIVSATDMQDTVTGSFPAAAGTGTVGGIPAGTGRSVSVRGLDATGIIRFQGVANNVTIGAGQVTTVPITLHAPVTTASPTAGTYTSPLSVTLTASEPAKIYYTTSGIEPTTSSTNGTSPLNITITATSTLMFFAIDSGFAQEKTNTEVYTITP